MNSLRLPGTAGGGPGSYTIQAQMPDVVTIQENTRVRVDDVNPTSNSLQVLRDLMLPTGPS
ncbi:hypothetical protein PICSAR246_04534 [Mycobacterium avium subsp. paratuberculosis]|nr:hypothetical protein PICSAR246_04534 [Mycobacterium avium subsp. paratuberculosis]